MPEADADLALLEQTARMAGDIALTFWRSEMKIWEKPGLGPVSEADLAVNAALKEMLRPARPLYGWLSEEDADGGERLGKDHVFIIDPIDGTRSFIEGSKDFTLSMAIVRAGRPVAAVVYAPAHDALYRAVAGGGACCNGYAITASIRSDLTGADVLVSSAHLAPEYWPGGVPKVRRSFRGSVAYRLCLVAQGGKDAMVTLRDSWEWDIAAGCLIAQESGIFLTDKCGEDLLFNQKSPKFNGVLAAPPGLHRQIMNGLGYGTRTKT